MNKPKISIVVPIYNVETYISKCLDSLINQTLKEIEILCVDDCSSDNSVSIVKEYMKKDKRIVLLQHQSNKGLASSRNTGLKHAKAELIAFVDSDDYVDLDTYEKAISVMTPEIDLVCFGIDVVGGNETDEQYYQIKYSDAVNITKNILEKTDVSSCNKIFRKSIINQYNISYPDGLKYEDAYFFNVYCSRIKRVYFIPQKFYHYIRREGSIMAETFSQKIGMSIDHVKVGIKLYEYLKENDLLLKWDDYFYNIFLSFISFSLRNEKNKKGKDKIYQLVNNFIRQEKILFDRWPELNRSFAMIKSRTFETGNRKLFLGLLKIKENLSRKKYYFLGIPLLRIKYKINETKYYVFSLIPIFRKHKPTHFCLSYKFDISNFHTLNYDETQLLQELKKMEPFTYIPNPGNMGDILIAAGTLLFFEKHHLNYKMFDGNFSGNLVYGGGGGLVPFYKEHWQKLLKNTKTAKKILILPSSVYDVPEFIQELDERFIVFARDKNSYQYLLSFNTKASVFLDNDMALYLTDEIFSKKTQISSTEINALNYLYQMMNGLGNIVFFMRQDIEAVQKLNSDLDISDCFWLDENVSKDWIFFGAQMMLSAIDSVDALVTDRLHVGIAGILMGKDVYWLDNNYHKIKNVYQYSLSNQKNIHFCESLPNKNIINTKHTSSGNLEGMFNFVLEEKWIK